MFPGYCGTKCYLPKEDVMIVKQNKFYTNTEHLKSLYTMPSTPAYTRIIIQIMNKVTQEQNNHINITRNYNEV